MNPTDAHGRPVTLTHDPTDDDVVDLGKGTDGSATRLRCTKCPDMKDEAPGGAATRPVRLKSDPKTVVRCAVCGKKHGRGSLFVV